ncbi:MAG: hemolysin family protein [Fimbriimonadaceae bacterium]|nr:HlyC/CorC family transporter [Chthonomonadaceae bacterium]MCO5295628.1 hemolysin family protein [Fimbriimonadaceae bacterium]
MEGWGLKALGSCLLVLGAAFFVAAEYSLLGARKSRVDSLARKGSGSAKVLSDALTDLAPYIASIQIAITMLGIAVGSMTEPFVTDLLTNWLGAVDRRISFTLSFIAVTYVLVVLGELVPKYLALRVPERLALFVIRPLHLFTKLAMPLVWLVQSSGSGVLKLMRIDPKEEGSDALPKDELLLLIRAGGAQGVLEKVHADLISRALKLDTLCAGDLMIHRLDIEWIDVATPPSELLEAMSHIRHTRVPVCRGDIDEVVGILYLHDVVRAAFREDVTLQDLVREAVVIPENLPMDRMIQTMREAKIQMLLVVDEYGGTSGLVTLEDLVEEVFGELEDRLESERPPIERHPGGRISARAGVRFDELVDYLGLSFDEEPTTDTLATLMVDSLGHMPKLGDSIETPLGTLRVENMARRRITRVSIHLLRQFQEAAPETR